MSRTKMVTALPPIIERQFQAELVKFAHLCGWRVAHFRPARLLDKDGRSRWRTPVAADGAGWPDLVLVRPPQIYFVECKRDGAALTPEQQVWLEWLLGCRSSGYVQVFVWHPADWPEIEERLR